MMNKSLSEMQILALYALELIVTVRIKIRELDKTSTWVHRKVNSEILDLYPIWRTLLFCYNKCSYILVITKNNTFTGSRDSLEDLCILAATNFSQLIHLEKKFLLRYNLHTIKLTHSMDFNIRIYRIV